MTKPSNPNLNIPATFATNGDKTEFDATKIADGFHKINPDVFPGDVLNKFIDDHCKGLNYSMAMAAYLDAFGLKSDGSVDLTAPQVGVTPTAANHLATKNYVDNNSGSGIPFALLSGNVDALGVANILNAPGSGTTNQTWIQPVLSADGTLGTGTLSVYAVGAGNNNTTYLMFDSNTSSNPWNYVAGTYTDIFMYTSDNLILDALTITQGVGAYSMIANGEIFGSADGSAYTSLGTFTGSTTASSILATINASSGYHYFKLRIYNSNASYGGFIFNIAISGHTIVSVSTATSMYFNVGGTNPNLKLTYADKTKEELSSLATLTNLTTNGSFAIVKEKGVATVSTLQVPVYGKDFYCDFSSGAAVDEYGLHQITTVGLPAFTNGKFNSNGVTGLYSNNFNSLGSGAWCVQGKFCSTNTSTQQSLMSSDTAGNANSFTVAKNTSNKLALYLSSISTSNDIASGVLGNKSDWATNIEYYIRVRFNGSKYYVDWSLDGITWTNDITVTSSTVVYQTGTGIIFGIADGLTLYPFIGTMDELQVTIGNSTCVRRNKITIGKVFPASPINGDYHCLIACELKTYKRISGAWVETQYVPLGNFIVSGGTIQSYSTTPYNQNGFEVNQTIQGFKTPDWQKAQVKAWATTYTAPCDGFLKIHVGSTVSGGATLLLNGSSVGLNCPQCFYFFDDSAGGIGHLIPISKDDTYYICTYRGTLTETYIHFIPMKGIN